VAGDLSGPRIFRPEELKRGELYQLLNRSIAPRPIAFVSSLDSAGVANLAPFSYFTAGGVNPPSLVFSVLYDRNAQPKDTLRNIRATREYTVNVVNREMAERMNLTSGDWPPEVDEFVQAGFTKEPSLLVTPSRVAESPVALECRLHLIVPHGDGPMSAHYVIGEVVAARVHGSCLDPDGLPDPERIDPIGRMGKDSYVHATGAALFEMRRPDVRSS